MNLFFEIRLPTSTTIDQRLPSGEAPSLVYTPSATVSEGIYTTVSGP